jgi:hypothetical protein
MRWWVDGEAGSQGREHVAPSEEVVTDGRGNREGKMRVMVERVKVELKGSSEVTEELKHKSDIVEEAQKMLQCW